MEFSYLPIAISSAVNGLLLLFAFAVINQIPPSKP